MGERGLKKRLEGVVVSNRMDKTVLVRVERLTKHPMYGKYVKRRANYMAHDPENRCHVGDKVKIVETRPISKRKRWQLTEIVEASDSED